MADFVFNIAKGRVAELYNRVDTADPTDAGLMILVINAGAATDDQMGDTDDVAALLATAANEVTNSNYARKYLVGSDISALSADDTNNRMDLDIPDQTWTGVAAGDAWTDLIVAYIPDSNPTGGRSADSACIPLTCHDFAVTPDGSDITAVINAAGFFRAS